MVRIRQARSIGATAFIVLALSAAGAGARASTNNILAAATPDTIYTTALASARPLSPALSRRVFRKWRNVVERQNGKTAITTRAVFIAGDTADRTVAASQTRATPKTGFSPYKALPSRWRIEAIHRYFNRFAYAADTANWRRRDYWATPAEFTARGAGDCEDFAIAKYFALREAGFSADAMRIVVTYDTARNIGHAILSVNWQGETLILDNRNKTVTGAASLSGQRLLYAVNETGAWLYRQNIYDADIQPAAR